MPRVKPGRRQQRQNSPPLLFVYRGLSRGLAFKRCTWCIDTLAGRRCYLSSMLYHFGFVMSLTSVGLMCRHLRSWILSEGGAESYIATGTEEISLYHQIIFIFFASLRG